MAGDGVILAIDQGTTGSKVVIVDAELQVIGRATTEFPQIYPEPGWVEHDPAAIWESVEQSLEAAMAAAGIAPTDVRAIGITNQRETTVVWDRATSEPVYNAIVWQCRRTTEVCRALRADGHTELIRERTGLVPDPYFSGTKVAWILDHVPGARARAEAGELAFGTIDSYVLWRLTSGAVHATEVSNASRTLLFNIHSAAWDDDLLRLLRVPRAVLPEVRSSCEVYGHTRGLRALPDGIPIAGIAGDQQAALFGQACFEAGQAKVTYGTGAFVLMNTGDRPVTSSRGLLTTIAWKLGDAPTQYALEGSVFIAGAVVQWLRDELRIIDDAAEIEALARSVDDSGGVVFVPAFAGLGAPYWDPDARGALLGLTRGSGRAHIARAALEGIAHQVADVVEAMSADAGRELRGLRVDGGAAADDLLLELQADLLGSSVRRPTNLETTAAGAAFLAGLAVGYFESVDDITARWREDAHVHPSLDAAARQRARGRWHDAIGRLRSRDD